MKFIHRQVKVLLIIRCRDQIMAGSVALQSESYDSLCLSFVIIHTLPFSDWTCSACWREAEVTLSLQVDLVLSDVAATTEA